MGDTVETKPPLPSESATNTPLATEVSLDPNSQADSATEVCADKLANIDTLEQEKSAHVDDSSKEDSPSKSNYADDQHDITANSAVLSDQVNTRMLCCTRYLALLLSSVC